MKKYTLYPNIRCFYSHFVTLFFQKLLIFSRITSQKPSAIQTDIT